MDSILKIEQLVAKKQHNLNKNFRNNRPAKLLEVLKLKVIFK